MSVGAEQLEEDLVCVSKVVHEYSLQPAVEQGCAVHKLYHTMKQDTLPAGMTRAQWGTIKPKILIYFPLT